MKLHGSAMLALTILFSAFLSVAQAQNSTVQGNTVNLVINDQLLGEAGYVASIVEACADRTVYNIRCTSGTPLDAFEPRTCGPDAPAFDLTEGPEAYIVTSVWERTQDQTASTVLLTESCTLRGGTTIVRCQQTLTEIVGGATTTVVKDEVAWDYRYDVLITGGAEKTANPTGTACAATASATSAPSNPAPTVTAATSTATTTAATATTTTNKNDGAKAADVQAINLMIGFMMIAGMIAALSS